MGHAAAVPLDEVDRQDAVERSGILRRGQDRDLQLLVERTAQTFNTEIAAISVLDRRRQWFVSSVGLDEAETPRDFSFCAHAIHRPGELLVVPDTLLDTRFANNPYVNGMPGVRFYAGKPLVTRAGYPIGALCIVDTKPRPRSPDLYELTFLAFQAERLINDRI